MVPVIKARLGGLFCGRWTPEGGGVVCHSSSGGGYAVPSLPACHQPFGKKVPAWNFADFRGRGSLE